MIPSSFPKSGEQSPSDPLIIFGKLPLKNPIKNELKWGPDRLTQFVVCLLPKYQSDFNFQVTSVETLAY